MPKLLIGNEWWGMGHVAKEQLLKKVLDGPKAKNLCSNHKKYMYSFVFLKKVHTHSI